MDKGKVLKLLNEALSMEYTQYIRLVTEADVLTGFIAPALAGELKEMAAEELTHAGEIRQRVVALGGEPTTQVGKIELGRKPERIVKEAIEAEKRAVEIYRQLMKLVPKEENLLIYETVEDILRDEQADLEELERLLE